MVKSPLLISPASPGRAAPTYRSRVHIPLTARSSAAVGKANASVAAAFDQRPWLAPAILILVLLAAYANCLTAGFIYDDFYDIVENEHLRRLWPPWSPLVDHVQGKTFLHTRPVVVLSFAANVALGGIENAWRFHAVNLVIHVLAALTLFDLVRQTLLRSATEHWRRDATGIALAASLIWAVHPLQTESVTYIVQRDESLMGLFFLLTLNFAMRSMTAPAPGPGGSLASRPACWLWDPRKWRLALRSWFSFMIEPSCRVRGAGRWLGIGRCTPRYGPWPWRWSLFTQLIPAAMAQRT